MEYFETKNLPWCSSLAGCGCGPCHHGLGFDYGCDCDYDYRSSGGRCDAGEQGNESANLSVSRNVVVDLASANLRIAGLASAFWTDSGPVMGIAMSLQE